jgi:hypothetical protein
MNGTFTLDGRELKYKITWHTSWGGFDKTEFYETYDIKKRRRWILWGEEVEIITPHTMFTIFCDFHSAKFSKEYWRREIRKKLKEYDSLKARDIEIKNGEFV